MNRYKLKPVEVEAIQFKGTDSNFEEIDSSCKGRIYKNEEGKCYFRIDKKSPSKDIPLYRDYWVVVKRMTTSVGQIIEAFEIHGNQTFLEKFEKVDE